MSRVGKNPVAIPQGVDVSLNGRALTVKGKLGQLEYTVPMEVNCDVSDSEITYTPKSEKNKAARALWGTARANTANMVKGVSEGWSKSLEIIGVGYRAAVKGQQLDLNLGFSHPVLMDIPAGLDVKVEGNTNVTISGFDKEAVGQFAANVRKLRKPEPYKGKGIRYAGEHIVRKEGKKK